jgi:hypothetical protein
MNVTIKTLTVQMDSKEVPLTRAMVNQMPWFEDRWTIADFESGDCKVLGEVSLPDKIWLLVQTPHGIQISSTHSGVRNIATQLKTRIERIILLK